MSIFRTRRERVVAGIGAAVVAVAAVALAGTGTPEFTDMVTLTWVPSGCTALTVPTGTPSTRTVDPGKTLIASLK